MKKVKYIICSLVVMFIGLGMTNAASLNVTTNKTTVVVGNTVTITVNASGAAGWEYCLKYDTDIFTLTSATSDTGGTCVKTGSSLIGYSKVTYKLKAKKSGSSTITLKNAAMYDDLGKQISSSVGSVTVKAKTQAEIEASYSTNAYLSSLRVVDYVITPEFKKDTLEYSLEVENEIDKITIKATKADSAASVSGTGEKELTEGLNKFSIVVTAEKGNKKTYVINVTRKELNPIHVDVDGFDYTIVRKAESLEAPIYYSSTEIEVEGEMVPAFKSDITGYTLVGLKDEEGNVDLYRYTDNGYEIYNQIGTEGVMFIPLDAPKLLDDYQQVKNVKINDITVKTYTNDTKSNYVMAYGMNAATGKVDWYRYDTIEKSFQRYEEEIVEEDNNDIYFLLTIVFASVSGLALLLVIILVVTNSKVRKKNAKLISMLQALREAKNEKEESLEKQIEKNEKSKEKSEELRKKQEEFLETSENEIVQDDVELEEIQEEVVEKKTKRGRKKKES